MAMFTPPSARQLFGALVNWVKLQSTVVPGNRLSFTVLGWHAAAYCGRTCAAALAVPAMIVGLNDFDAARFDRARLSFPGVLGI
jgi:hypothetical protein